MAAWDADVYLTGSPKAIGLPPGLALLVASPRALARRSALRASVPMGLDWQEWQPVMKAYEEKRPAYFATPATPLILGLDVALGEILEQGVEARWAAHARAACAITAAWNTLGLLPVPVEPRFQAHTLSALKYPEGVDAGLVGKIAAHGVTVAGGLHPEIRNTYFRVGHMGYAITRPDMLLCTVDAVEAGLAECGHRVERGAAVAALKSALGA
jgi:alanine-glyoxylate transaminase/serine-glyoxylate transaminase/serine-pyruvate transaminase